MAKKLYEESSVSGIAAAIRAKGGSGTYTVGEMAQAISDLPSGGGGDWTSTGVAALSEPSGAIVVNGPIEDHAFFKRSGITSITGAVTKIGAYGCDNCTSLTSIDLSSITGNFGSNALSNCPLLTSVSSNTTANLGGYMIANSGVTYASFPYSASVGNVSTPGNTFRNAPYLVSAFLSRAAMNANASYQNTPADLFRNCPMLEIADIGWLAANQWKSMFTDCTSLRTIITRGATKVPTLSAWSEAAFGGVYTNPTQSTIYIPKALYDHLGDGTSLDFYAASNWSAMHTAGVTFAQIEGSIYEI